MTENHIIGDSYFAKEDIHIKINGHSSIIIKKGRQGIIKEIISNMIPLPSLLSGAKLFTMYMIEFEIFDYINISVCLDSETHKQKDYAGILKPNPWNQIKQPE